MKREDGNTSTYLKRLVCQADKCRLRCAVQQQHVILFGGRASQSTRCTQESPSDNSIHRCNMRHGMPSTGPQGAISLACSTRATDLDVSEFAGLREESNKTGVGHLKFMNTGKTPLKGLTNEGLVASGYNSGNVNWH